VGPVVGIVLGAGASTRLGRPKQALPFGGGSLLAHVVADVEASALQRVVVVLGGDAVAAAALLRPGRAEVVENEAYGTGCASSLLAGLDAAGSCDAIMLLLGDMPGVTAAVIDQLLAAWRHVPTWAAVTEYADGIGHPFVFSDDSFSTLRALHGDKAVWKVIDREPVERVARIPIDQPRPLDVDTWADYLAVCDRFGYAPGPRET
jgi:molybdenum cofactor cytidylyltransferase